MKVTIKDIEKLAKLSRIEVSESELEKTFTQIDSILSYVGQVSDVEINTSDKNFENFNSCREDVVTNESGYYTQRLLDIAPSKENGYFKVKKIL